MRRRLVGQAQQLYRVLTKTVEQIFSLSTVLSLRADNLHDLIENIKRAASPSRVSGGVLERDVFNLRKILVLTTLDGVVFGVDSADGRLVWRFWLGDHFQPLSSLVAKKQLVPLLVQRTTAYYQLDPQVLVAFADKVNMFSTFETIASRPHRVDASWRSTR